MNDDDIYEVQFMFDSEHTKSEMIYDFNNQEIGKLRLLTIGDHPGHLQSGQYVWPAAYFAARYIMDNWIDLRTAQVLELGAGCGLTGLVVSKLVGIEQVIFTDYDYGCLKIIKDNIPLNHIDESKCLVAQLEWGNLDSIRSLLEESDRLCDEMMIIGSDLLYAVEICEPLLKTVDYMLSKGAKLFLLVSSFDVGSSINEAITSICKELQISIEEKACLDESSGQCRVQYFKKKYSSCK
jgi:predicted nicotinamide N-methyase